MVKISNVSSICKLTMFSFSLLPGLRYLFIRKSPPDDTKQTLLLHFSIPNHGKSDQRTVVLFTIDTKACMML